MSFTFSGIPAVNLDMPSFPEEVEYWYGAKSVKVPANSLLDDFLHGIYLRIEGLNCSKGPMWELLIGNHFVAAMRSNKIPQPIDFYHHFADEYLDFVTPQLRCDLKSFKAIPFSVRLAR